MGGKGAAAPGCSYPSSGIFPEGNRNRVLKQPVPSIVDSIHGLFIIPVVLFWDVSLHPASFAQAIPNPIPGHCSPARDRGSHGTTWEHRKAVGNVILMVAHAQLGECWLLTGLWTNPTSPFRESQNLGHPTQQGTAPGMLGSSLRGLWKREGGSVFLCPFPRGVTSPHNRAAHQNTDLAHPGICTTAGKNSCGLGGSQPFLTSAGTRAPAVPRGRGRAPSPLPPQEEAKPRRSGTAVAGRRQAARGALALRAGRVPGPPACPCGEGSPARGEVRGEGRRRRREGRRGSRPATFPSEPTSPTWRRRPTPASPNRAA